MPLGLRALVAVFHLFIFNQPIPAVVSDLSPSLWVSVSKQMWIDFVQSIFKLLDFSISNCNNNLVCLFVCTREFLLTLQYCKSLAPQHVISHKCICIFSFPLLPLWHFTSFTSHFNNWCPLPKLSESCWTVNHIRTGHYQTESSIGLFFRLLSNHCLHSESNCYLKFLPKGFPVAMHKLPSSLGSVLSPDFM